MKRSHKLLIILILVLTVIALLVFPVGVSFTLPFGAEEVSSVIMYSIWGYKEATDAEDISMIAEKMNSARLCGEFDFESYEPREGDYGCTFYFFLKNGRTYEYTVMTKPGLTTIFRDADGVYYKAKKIPMEKIYNEFEGELKPGNPFQAK